MTVSGGARLSSGSASAEGAAGASPRTLIDTPVVTVEGVRAPGCGAAREATKTALRARKLVNCILMVGEEIG